MTKRPAEEFLSQEVEDLTRGRVRKALKLPPIKDRNAGGDDMISPLFLGVSAQDVQVDSLVKNLDAVAVEESRPEPRSTFSHGEGSPFDSVRGSSKGK